MATKVKAATPAPAKRARKPQLDRVELMPIGRRTEFQKNGRTIELRDPDGAPSDAMLALLWKNGHLVITAETVKPFTKANASHALNVIFAAQREARKDRS